MEDGRRGLTQARRNLLVGFAIEENVRTRVGRGTPDFRTAEWGVWVMTQRFGFVVVLVLGLAAFVPIGEEAATVPAIKIALQAGHWRADEAPRELSGLKRNGTSWDGVHEWRFNLTIAEHAAELLREKGYDVELLPAVVPPRYRADLFIAIHADGSEDPRAQGYRVAASRRDRTGQARAIARLLDRSYGSVTGLRRLATTTRRMRNYYAFNYRRYRHALHPSTPGVIIETGFLTSRTDRGVIVEDPLRAATGIATAVEAWAAAAQQP